jgi:hypothetical protein
MSRWQKSNMSTSLAGEYRLDKIGKAAIDFDPLETTEPDTNDNDVTLDLVAEESKVNALVKPSRTKLRCELLLPLSLFFADTTKRGFTATNDAVASAANNANNKTTTSILVMSRYTLAVY